MKKTLGLVTLFIIYLITLTACSIDSEREKYDEISYSDILFSLVTENTDLQTISDFTDVPVDLLIKIKYGIISENEELTSYLRDLKYAYDQKDQSAIEVSLVNLDVIVLYYIY